MDYKRLYKKVIAAWRIIKGEAKPSYAQLGEDRILEFLFTSLGIKNPTYLDIGTNHPIMGNNSYSFYLKGGRGVCVEADPSLYNLIKKKRPQDIIINAGIGLTESTEADFYIFPTSGWNTFSKEEAEYRNKNGQPYRRVIKMPLKNINTILKENFTTNPDIISIDVEGLDFDIVKSLQFNLYAPKVMILETIRFGGTNKEEKQQDIINYVIAKGYTIYADTWVNTIFCRKELI